MKGEEIANRARNSISAFCINECKALCCRKGFLSINRKQADLLTNKKTTEFESEEKLLHANDGSYLLKLQGGCPSLEDNMCKVHKNKDRPKMCKDFPIFVEGNNIRFAKGCLAVEERLFYLYEKEFLKEGFSLTIS